MSPIEKINAEYSDSIKCLLEVIKDRLSGRGFPLGEITDETEGEFASGFGINDCAALQITIAAPCKEEVINFQLGLYNMGGRKIFSIIPYNFTKECWVSETDASAVSDRWEVFMGLVLSAMPLIIDKTVEMVK